MDIRQSKTGRHLADLLNQISTQQECMRADEVQALILALVSGPDEVVMDEWLAEILAGSIATDDTRTQLLDALTQLQQALTTQLAAKIPPALWLYQDEQNQADWSSWCNAYLYALERTDTDWFAREDEAFEDLCYPIMALAGVYDAIEDEPAIMPISAAEKQQLQTLLPDTLLKIYQYWQAVKKTPTTIRRDGEKTGRNDPCPCGSGKKYKACCLQKH
ncbi:YecA family protein [Neisseriaceae bacterium ESL0693]|nr:YecA family protein [Neisseriaceae bacterium ESL0693]